MSDFDLIPDVGVDITDTEKIEICLQKFSGIFGIRGKTRMYFYADMS